MDAWHIDWAQHGIEDLKEIRKAYVESDGHISVIRAPARSRAPRRKPA